MLKTKEEIIKVPHLRIILAGFFIFGSIGLFLYIIQLTVLKNTNWVLALIIPVFLLAIGLAMSEQMDEELKSRLKEIN